MQKLESSKNEYKQLLKDQQLENAKMQGLMEAKLATQNKEIYQIEKQNEK